MQTSRSGLVVATIYTTLAVGSVAWGYSLTQPEASTVLMQLPVVPILGLLLALGLLEQAAAVPLVAFYAACIPVIALGLYAACWVFGLLGLRTRLLISLGFLIVVSIPLFWPVRQPAGLP